MALKFKQKEQPTAVTSYAKEGKDVSIAQTGTFITEEILTKPLKEIIDSGTSPREIVEKVEKWCPMVNAQTVIGHKNISKIKNKPYFKPIFECLSKNKPSKFVIKDLLEQSAAEKFSSGDAQRRVLAAMICMGMVKKIREPYETKGKEASKVKDFFSWNDQVSPCKFYKNDCCTLNWKDADETRFFTNQYSEDTQEDED